MPLASKEKNIFEKLRGLGLTLKKSRDKSFRSCIKCDNAVKRHELSVAVFKTWEENERGSLAAASAAPSTSSLGSDPAASVASPSPTPSSPPSSPRSSTSEKRTREKLTPSKTPRKEKKRCLIPSPPSPTAQTASTSTRRSIVEVKLCYSVFKQFNFYSLNVSPNVY